MYASFHKGSNIIISLLFYNEYLLEPLDFSHNSPYIKLKTAEGTSSAASFP